MSILSGEIGNAVHRITVKSILDIVNLSKKGDSIEKEYGTRVFEQNAKADIDTSWKRFLIAGVDKPFDPIMDDGYTTGDRLVDKLVAEKEEINNYSSGQNLQYAISHTA